MPWISSNEALPEREVYVLVYAGLHKEMRVRHIPKPMEAWEKKLRGIPEDSKVCGDNGRHWYPGGLPVENTYWMPLPEPPK